MELLHEELTNKIIKTFYEVYNQLGYGFLEKVYQNAMYLELKERGFKVEAQKRINVFYKENVGTLHYLFVVLICILLVPFLCGLLSC